MSYACQKHYSDFLNMFASKVFFVYFNNNIFLTFLIFCFSFLPSVHRNQHRFDHRPLNLFSAKNWVFWKIINKCTDRTGNTHSLTFLVINCVFYWVDHKLSNDLIVRIDQKNKKSFTKFIASNLSDSQKCSNSKEMGRS